MQLNGTSQCSGLRAAWVSLVSLAQDSSPRTVLAESFDSPVHLTVDDVAVDSHASSSLMRLRQKQSKTDPFRHGVDIHLGRSDAAPCPVTAMLAYPALHGAVPGPLFYLRTAFRSPEIAWPLNYGKR